MYTQCPACHTVFTVTPAQLAAARGTVRCGVCQRPFSALDRLAATLPPQARAALRRTSGPAGLSGSARGGPPKTEQATAVPSAGSVYFPQSAQQPRRPHTAATLAWGAGIVIALGVLVVQYAYFMRADLARYDRLRPWLERLCEIADCRIPPLRDVSKIIVLNRQVVEDADRPGALLVRATIENRAPFAQPYPILQLSLSDMDGRLLGRGRFTPQQYLASTDLPAQLPSHRPVHVRLKIADPGSNAVNFEFTFL